MCLIPLIALLSHQGLSFFNANVLPALRSNTIPYTCRMAICSLWIARGLYISNAFLLPGESSVHVLFESFCSLLTSPGFSCRMPICTLLIMRMISSNTYVPHDLRSCLLLLECMYSLLCAGGYTSRIPMYFMFYAGLFYFLMPFCYIFCSVILLFEWLCSL